MGESGTINEHERARTIARTATSKKISWVHRGRAGLRSVSSTLPLFTGNGPMPPLMWALNRLRGDASS